MARSKGGRFLFLHIPKTAGASMQTFLASHYSADEIVLAGNLTRLLGLDSRDVARTKLLQGHFFGAFPQYWGEHRFTLTVLRDPIERALSHYGHIVRDRDHYLHQRALELGSLEAFLDADDTRPAVNNFQARMLALETNVEDAFNALSDAQRGAWVLERNIETTIEAGLTGEVLLARAIARLNTIDVVGVTERISDVAAVLCFKLGWLYPDRLDVLNVNESRMRRSCIDASTLQRLTELNSVDRALYDVAQHRFEAAFRAMLSELLNRGGPIRKLRKMFL